MAPVLPDLPSGVEAAARGDAIVVINHTPTRVTLPDATTLAPYGWAIRRP